jgi:16S rRNA (uracil1498-N3)-methyltransferase
VTAPLFLLAAGALDGVGPGSAVLLDGEEGRHAVTVRRLRAGERLDVADGTGVLARCLVRAVGRAGLELVVESVQGVAAPLPRLVLVQALAKGGRDEQAVEAATELGVDAVIPWQAERSVSVWAGERRAKGRDRWQAAVREAAKQSRRARVPQVAELVDGTSLAAAVRQAALALVLDGSAEQPIPPDGLPTAGDLLLVVGPEGGISEPELAALTGAGALPVRLGPHVLRTSTAGPAALALLCRQLRW